MKTQDISDLETTTEWSDAITEAFHAGTKEAVSENERIQYGTAEHQLALLKDKVYAMESLITGLSFNVKAFRGDLVAIAEGLAGEKLNPAKKSTLAGAATMKSQET